MAGVQADFRLVVGLGNVGTRYAGTRHNAGFWYADRLIEHLGGTFAADRKAHGELARCQSPDFDLRVLKPDTLMNRSGTAVAAVAGFHKIPAAGILVAHDELDLPAGAVRIKYGGGHGGHNGLRDIANKLGTRDFWRLRIGIGHPGVANEVINYVLNRPSPEDRQQIEAAIDDAVRVDTELFVQGDVEAAMRILHARP